jgi:hypothetical protein
MIHGILYLFRKERKLFKYKWVYRTKYASDGSVEIHKARLVSKGFSKFECIGYNETFSPISKLNFICPVLSLVSSLKWEVHQMDVKSCLLAWVFERINLHGTTSYLCPK